MYFVRKHLDPRLNDQDACLMSKNKNKITMYNIPYMLNINWAEYIYLLLTVTAIAMRKSHGSLLDIVK